MSDRKPRIGILGIMQDLYDEMIPGIAQRQEGYAREIGIHLADVEGPLASRWRSISWRSGCDSAFHRLASPVTRRGVMATSPSVAGLPRSFCRI